MTEKGTPSETFHIERLPSGLEMLCRPNGGCRPATKEELFFDSENSRLRDELEKKTAALAKAGDLLFDLWNGSPDMVERYKAVSREIHAALQPGGQT